MTKEEKLLRQKLACIGLGLNSLRGSIILLLGTDDFEAVKKGWDVPVVEPCTTDNPNHMTPPLTDD